MHPHPPLCLPRFSRRFVGALHLRGMTWEEIYWLMWGTTHVFRCRVCGEWFTADELGRCAYHPHEPVFGASATERLLRGSGGASAGVSAGAGATALRGILHCRTPPPGCAPDAASNGHSQSAAVATVAAAAALAGATDKKKSRRRSSKSEGGESTLVGYQM